MMPRPDLIVSKRAKWEQIAQRIVELLAEADDKKYSGSLTIKFELNQGGVTTRKFEKAWIEK